MNTGCMAHETGPNDAIIIWVCQDHGTPNRCRKQLLTGWKHGATGRSREPQLEEDCDDGDKDEGEDNNDPHRPSGRPTTAASPCLHVVDYAARRRRQEDDIGRATLTKWCGDGEDFFWFDGNGSDGVQELHGRSAVCRRIYCHLEQCKLRMMWKVTTSYFCLIFINIKV